MTVIIQFDDESYWFRGVEQELGDDYNLMQMVVEKHTSPDTFKDLVRRAVVLAKSTFPHEDIILLVDGNISAHPGMTSGYHVASEALEGENIAVIAYTRDVTAVKHHPYHPRSPRTDGHIAYFVPKESDLLLAIVQSTEHLAAYHRPLLESVSGALAKLGNMLKLH